VALTDRGICERTGQETFAAPGRPGDEHIVVLSHPRALGQAQDDGAVKAPGRSPVDVFDAGRVAQPGRFQPGGEAPAVAGIGFFVDQQAEPVGEAELVIGPGGAQLLGQAGGHGRQPEGLQFLNSLVG
jgi:hypothetical protein